MRKIFDKTVWKFILVGIINTLFGMTIMFGLYNLLHCSYWISSAANYCFGSVLSYFLNKYFTFQNKRKDWKIVLRFGINILVCYFVSYSSAKLIIYCIFSGKSIIILENGAMLLGMGLFVICNYIGQKFLVFRK